MADIKSGKHHFTPEDFKDWTFEDFAKQYRGKIDHDINEIWKQIQSALPKCELKKVIDEAKSLYKTKTVKDGSIGKPGKKSRKS
jgi:hypothetical protein